MVFFVIENYTDGYDLHSRVQGLMSANSVKELARKLQAKVIKNNEKSPVLGKDSSKFFASQQKLVILHPERSKRKKAYLLLRSPKGQEKWKNLGLAAVPSIEYLALQLNSDIIHRGSLPVPYSFESNPLTIMTERRGRYSYQVIGLEKRQVEKKLLADELS